MSVALTGLFTKGTKGNLEIGGWLPARDTTPLAKAEIYSHSYKRATENMPVTLGNDLVFD
jgi:hypothetical protein